MKGEVYCQFNKYGFCKYKEDCKRKHHSEEVENHTTCKDIKNCNKIHSEVCKKKWPQ